MRIRRIAPVLGAAVAVIAAATPSFANPQHTVPLTTSAPSTQHDVFAPLAGSPVMLVYARQERLASDDSEANGDPRVGSAPITLYARDIDGGVNPLGVRPTGAQDYSTVGDIVAAAKNTGDDTPEIDAAYVWHISTGKQTTINLPSGATYLSAGAGGIVYAIGNTVTLRNTDGTATSLGTPFGASNSSPIDFGAPGPTGEVVGDDAGDVALISWTAPYPVTALDVPQTTHVFPVGCSAVTATYAACATEGYDDDGGYDLVRAVLVPLDGSPATEQPDPIVINPNGVGVAGSTLLYAIEETSESGEPEALFSQPAGTSTPTRSPAAVGYPLVSAYGEGILPSSDNTSMLQVSPTAQVSTLTSPVLSPTTVDSFALIPGRILYSDDQPLAAAPDAIESVFSRTLSLHGGRVHAAAAKRISTASGQVTGNIVGASSSVQVYATRQGALGETGDADLYVRYGGKTTVLHNAEGNFGVQVSGDKVLYERDLSTSVERAIYDAKTGHQWTITKRTSAIALWHDEIAYTTSQGAVYRENYVTGKTRKIAAVPANSADLVDYEVFIHGNWVGWHATSVFTQRVKSINRLRNTKTMAATVSLPHKLFGLASAGALLANQPDLTIATPIWLRSYAGHTREILTSRSYLAAPQIAGGVLAWADSTGVLRVSSVPSGA